MFLINIGLRNEVKGDDIDMAISVLLKSFIMSQKFVVANSLKNSFKKYIIDSRDNFTLLNKILSDLMTTRVNIYNYIILYKIINNFCFFYNSKKSSKDKTKKYLFLSVYYNLRLKCIELET